MNIKNFIENKPDIEALLHIENPIAYYSDAEVKEIIYPYLNRRYIINSLENEEAVRAMMLIYLINYMGYEKEKIDIQVMIKWGSKSYGYADIVIYNDVRERDQFRNIEGIIELKSKDEDEIKNQLESYVSASSAWWGCWTDIQKEKLIFKDIMGKIHNNILTFIPVQEDERDAVNNSKTIYDKYSYFKHRTYTDLKPLDRKSLDKKIQNCRDIIWRGRKSDSEISTEINKIITAKLYDELEGTKNEEPYKFQKGNDKNPVVASRIRQLAYLAINNYNTVNEDTGIIRGALKEDNYVSYIEPELKLTDSQIVKLVDELEGVLLSKSDADVRGRIFENVIQESYRTKGGQFFTPREIVKFIIFMLDVVLEKKLIDIACGTGGYLLYDMIYAKSKIEKQYPYNEQENMFNRYTRERIFGIEYNDHLAQIAQTDLRLHGNGGSRVLCSDSLIDLKELAAKGIIANSFGYVTINPAFGKPTRISDQNILKNFVLGHGKSSQDCSVLMLERAYELLENNGMLAIILPDNIVGRDKDYSDVRKFIKSNFKIEAIVGLPQHTFKISKANVGGYVLFLKKCTPPLNYKIFMAMTERIGYKNNKDDKNELISEETETMMHNPEITYPEYKKHILKADDNTILTLYNKYKDGQQIEDSKIKIIEFKDLKESLECKAYMFKNPFKDKKYPMIKLRDVLVKASVSTSLENPNELVKQITITQSGEVKLRNNKKVKAKTIETKDIYKIKKNTIVISLIDFYRGNVGFVPEELDNAITTWWFMCYEVRKEFTYEYVLHILQHSLMRKYALSLTSGATGRKYMEEEALLDIEIPNLPYVKQKSIINAVNDSYFKSLEKIDTQSSAYLLKMQSLIQEKRENMNEEFDKEIFGI
ncbi:N-6 DNA methylase [Clostridium perfringens]|nr:N-6 DNA methylase [Clostridium perfringens]